MKYAIFFALVIGTVIAYSIPGDVQVAHSEFVTPFLNHEMIEKINSGDRSWTAASNSFIEGKSVAQIKRLMGFKPNPETRKKGLPVKSPKVEGLPQNYDASQAHPHCTTIGTIFNQAECGSCWAFGCVEAVNDRFCIQSNGTVNITLSFMDEVCCGNAGGCDGGDPYDAWEYVSEGGLVTDSCYPYTIPTCPPAQQPCMNFVNTPNCANQCSNGQNWNNLLHYVTDVYQVSSDQQSIMSEIYTNGPVETCFTVYSDFLTYKSGVYQYTSGDALGGHCIKIIGWGVENGLPYWLCNNSWTTYWGDNGQFKILRGKDECGIEDEVVAGTPKV